MQKNNVFKRFRTSGINRLGIKSSLEKVLFDLSSKKLTAHGKVEWISHHIPKTAGTSLRLSLEHAYSSSSVFGVYRESGAKTLSQGENIWLPRNTKVIHGHFRSHVNHYDYFPNAKHMVWIRDPIERAWSLLGHLLAIKPNTAHFNLLKSRYLDRGNLDKAKLFECVVKDNELSKPFYVYNSYFEHIPIDKFDFVGSMHSLRLDFKRLSDVLGKKLVVENLNKRTGAKDLPVEAQRLEKFFSDEYKIVANYLNKSLGNLS